MLLISPNPKQKWVHVQGHSFSKTPMGFFEVPNETSICEELLAQGFSLYTPKGEVGTIAVPDEIKSAEMFAVVTRCTCDASLNPERFLPNGLSVHHGEPCPWGRQEDLGLIAAFYRPNPAPGFWGRISRLFRRKE